MLGQILPVDGLVEGTVSVCKGFRQLTCGKVGCTDTLVERRRTSEHLAVHLLRVDDAYGLGEVVSNHLNGGSQVGIAGYEHGTVVFVPEYVKKHVRGDVHVRAFLFRLDDADEGLCGFRVCDAHHDRMGKIATEYAFGTE